MMSKKGYHTIRDIAQIAGVTPGTISRALNDSPLVNKDTKERILQIAEDLGMQTEVGPMTKDDLFDADEIMFTGTAVEVVPIIRIADGSVPGNPEKEYMVGDGLPGPVTKQLRSTYLETVNGKQPRYDGWLTYVNE